MSVNDLANRGANPINVCCCPGHLSQEICPGACRASWRHRRPLCLRYKRLTCRLVGGSKRTNPLMQDLSHPCRAVHRQSPSRTCALELRSRGPTGSRPPRRHPRGTQAGILLLLLAYRYLVVHLSSLREPARWIMSFPCRGATRPLARHCSNPWASN